MKKLYFSLLFCLLISVGTIAQITTNIVGGKDTNIDEVPWQVLMEINGDDKCGGSIIAPNWILTAAHCVEGVNPADIRIFAGITERNHKNQGQMRYVSRIIRHPSYGANPNSIYENDIALLRLSTPLIPNNDVQVIDYATQADANSGWTDPGQTATVSGWGILSIYSTYPPGHLQSVDIPIVANAIAAGQYNPHPDDLDITANMLAAGNVGTGGEDACKGDSGGPLIVRDNIGRAILAGVVSFGVGCGSPNYMGIYTRVSRYCAWITEHIVSINGPSYFCNTATYTLTPNNIPSGSTVSWEVSPNNLFTNATGTGTSAFLDSNTTSAAEIELTFTINSSCGIITVTKSITTGLPYVYMNNFGCTNPYSSVCFLTGQTYFYPGETVGMVLESINTSEVGNGDPDWEWERISGGFKFVAYGGPGIGYPQNNGEKSIGSYANLQINGPNGSIQFRARARNECGWGPWKYFYWDVQITGYLYTFYPNPASSQITIENTAFKDGQQTLLNRTEQKGCINIYNFNGTLVKTTEYFLNQASYNLNVSDLKEGMYFMKIGGASKKETHKVLIRR